MEIGWSKLPKSCYNNDGSKGEHREHVSPLPLLNSLPHNWNLDSKLMKI